MGVYAHAPSPTLDLRQNGSMPETCSHVDESTWGAHVWIFVGDRRGVSGVFSSKSEANAWIERHRLTGMLSAYPLDIGIYDWTVKLGLYKGDKPKDNDPTFIGNFSSAYLPHYHYENGMEEAGDSGKGL